MTDCDHSEFHPTTRPDGAITQECTLCGEGAVDLLRAEQERTQKLEKMAIDAYEIMERYSSEAKEDTAYADRIQAVVDQQAEDEGLWLRSDDIAFAYIQQELRKLHSVIEGE